MSLQQYLSPDWQEVLAQEFQKDYFPILEQRIEKERAHKEVFPKEEVVFHAFNLTPFSEVKLVLLGQDPYHQKGQAEGLSFSVPFGQKIPPSLRNIFKELERDMNIPPAANGHLAYWGEQGVLLLNSVLTVVEAKPGVHSGLGWHQFTDAVIRQISARRNHVVFLLWGSYAQSKAELIDGTKHLVLTTSHPSPLSAHRGFLGCSHFSRANDWLVANGMSAIDWQLPDS
ncbi:MAG: uracil-DNA glycosylase [Bacteroidetes bacterium]|nr:uracil-DNA glycosylase [Bacteroidota bacterium]